MARMDGFQRFERIPGVRPVPLPVKNAVVGLCNWVESRKVTFTLSNMGRVQTAPSWPPISRALRPTAAATACSPRSAPTAATLCSAAFRRCAARTFCATFYRSLAESGLAVTLYASEVETE